MVPPPVARGLFHSDGRSLPTYIRPHDSAGSTGPSSWVLPSTHSGGGFYTGSFRLLGQIPFISNHASIVSLCAPRVRPLSWPNARWNRRPPRSL